MPDTTAPVPLTDEELERMSALLAIADGLHGDPLHRYTALGGWLFRGKGEALVAEVRASRRRLAAVEALTAEWRMLWDEDASSCNPELGEPDHLLRLRECMDELAAALERQ